MKPAGQIVSDIFVIICVVLGVLVVAMLAYVIYYYTHDLFARERKVNARVVRKRQKELGLDMPDSVSYLDDGDFGLLSTHAHARMADADSICQSWEFYVTFAFEGRAEEFGVPESIYASVSEGDEGALIYKGNSVKFFFVRIKPQV